MEQLYNKLGHKGQTLDTAPSLRLQSRPVAKNPKAFEDLGTTFGRKDSPKKPKFKPASSQPTRQGVPSTQVKPPGSRNANKVVEIEDDGSNDEIDFLSQSSNHDDDASDAYVHKDGSVHPWSEKYHPSQSQTLAKLKFHKKSVENKAAPSSPPKSPRKAKENGYTSSSGNTKGIGRSYATGSRVSSQPKPKPLVYVDSDDDDDEIKVSRPLKTSNRGVSPPRQGTSTSKTDNNAAIPKPRPKPRPIAKAQTFTSGSQSSQSRSQPRAAGSLHMELIPLGSRKGKEKEILSIDEVSEPRKSVPDPFPAISPPSSPVKPKVPAAFPTMSPLGSPKTPQQMSSSLKKVSAFPLSPLRPDDAGKAPVGSESAVRTTIKKPKAGKDRVDTRKAGRKKAQSKLEAFPMSTQVLASIGSPRSLGSSPMLGKRTSDDGNDDEHRAKKRREHQSLMESPTRHFFEDEGDSISINPNVDPKTLCPYCDTPLPESPTPLLVKLLATTAMKSRRDPRPANPLGLKAPLATFIAACQRHRFESQILPEAERKGWPKTIKWKKVARRVQAMSDDLETLIQDPGVDVDDQFDDQELNDLFNDLNEKGPKARSIFWQEVMAEVKKKGSRAVAGVRGQFANFEKTQPGYYGELGSVIIHQTLFNMFPPASFNSALVSPLTMNEFVSRILVPEVASRLIMEDKDLEGEEGMAEAVKILRESSAYGVAMFPEDGGEWGGSKKKDDDTTMGVGDLIVMERARKRRKELEEEDEREEEERQLAEDEAKAKAKKKKKESASKRKGKEKQRDDDLTSDATDSAVRTRPRPRPLAKATSSMSVAIDNDTKLVSMKLQSCDSAGNKNRRRAYPSDADTEPAEDSPIELSESDSSRKPRSRREWRRSPSASESWQRIPSSKPSSNSKTGRVLSDHNVELDVEFPPSDSSTIAVVDQSRPLPHRTNSRRLEKMDVDDDDIEFVDTPGSKTPLAKQGASRRFNDEATPKASHSRPAEGSTPVLVRLRRRKQREQQRAEEDDGWSRSMIDRKSSGNYDWLLSDDSQSSLANAGDNRSRR